MYYIDYPPLMPILLTLSATFWGVNEISLRLVTVFFSLILILLSVKIYLAGEITAQKIFLEFEKESLAVKEMRNVQGQVQTFNKKLSRLDTFEDQKINIAFLFNEILTTIPSGIYLTNFAYSKKASQITLSGFSPTRNILFQFKKNLEQEFQDVLFPPDSWIKANDINFQGVTFQQK